VKKAEHFRSLRRGLGPFLTVWSLVVTLVALEPDLSTALVIAMLGALIVFVAGARLSHFIFLGVLGAPLLWGQVSVGFRAARIEAFLLSQDTLAGASMVHVREARRAAAAGGAARARALARQVIDAWSASDVPVPAVSEMRELLVALPGGAAPPPVP